jgi:hypothetical protein
MARLGSSWAATNPHKAQEAIRLYKTFQYTQPEICAKVGCSEHALYDLICASCTKDERLRAAAASSKRRLYKHGPPHIVVGVTQDARGYLYARCPSWWTGKTTGGRVKVHKLVCAKAYGLTEIPKGFVVHHINHNRTDNRWCNLELMRASDHAAYHNKTRVRAKGR